MIAVVWQFQVKAGKQQEFEKFFGADGEWSGAARKSRSFLGSSFLRDQSRDTCYLLVEYWSEMVVYEQHRSRRASTMTRLEEQREALCQSVVPLGVFSALDVPDRDGPTWSRRDGV